MNVDNYYVSERNATKISYQFIYVNIIFLSTIFYILYPCYMVRSWKKIKPNQLLYFSKCFHQTILIVMYVYYFSSIRHYGVSLFTQNL